MDLEPLKSVLDDATWQALSAYVKDLAEARDAARRESIEGRRGLKERAEKADAIERQLQEALEAMGVTSFDEFRERATQVKGYADANKQFEAKLSRMQRDLQAAEERAKASDAKYRSLVQRATIAEAMQGHQFIAPDLMQTYIAARVKWEGDDLLYDAGDGKFLSVKDAVTSLVKTRPELIVAQGGTGAGSRPSNTNGKPSQANTVSAAEWEAAPPARKMELAQQGVTIAQ